MVRSGLFCSRKTIIVIRVEPTQLAFLIVGATMAGVALIILIMAVLATGDTRYTTMAKENIIIVCFLKGSVWDTHKLILNNGRGFPDIVPIIFFL